MRALAPNRRARTPGEGLFSSANVCVWARSGSRLVWRVGATKNRPSAHLERHPKTPNPARRTLSAVWTSPVWSGIVLVMAQTNVDQLLATALATLEKYDEDGTPKVTATPPAAPNTPPAPTDPLTINSLEGYRASRARAKSNEQLPTPAPPPTTPAPTPTNAPRTRGRKWTDDDYRMRGHLTPDERRSAGRRHLHAEVNATTFESIRTTAASMGVTLGEALDALLAS